MSILVTNGFPCFLIGEGSLVIRCTELLLQRDCAVYGIISPDRKIRNWAEKQNIPYFGPGTNLTAVLGKQPFDFLFSVVNSQVLAPEILALPRKMTINYHDSLLPKYAGVHATAWAIMCQEKQHGISWHIVEEGVDTGDILSQSPVEITRNETSFTLNAKCYETAVRSFEALVDDLLFHKEERLAQDLTKRSYFPLYKRPLCGGVLFFNQPAAAIDAFVRALTFGYSYPNPLISPKIIVKGTFFIVERLAELASSSFAPPGTVIDINGEAVIVATASNDVAIQKICTIDGKPYSFDDLAVRFSLTRGDLFAAPRQQVQLLLTEGVKQACRREQYWVEKLKNLQPLRIPYMQSALVDCAEELVKFEVPDTFLAYTDFAKIGHDHAVMSAFAAYLGRISNADCFDMGFRQSIVGSDWPVEFFTLYVPLRVELDFSASFLDFSETMQKRIARGCNQGTYARDIFYRYPEFFHAPDAHRFIGLSVAMGYLETLADLPADPLVGLSLIYAKSEKKYYWLYQPKAISRENVHRMTAQFQVFLFGIAAHPEQSVAKLPLLSESERHKMLVAWNALKAVYPQESCVHRLFEEQVKRVPQEIAVVCGEEALCYEELNVRANQLAHYLRRLGIGPETVVGICLGRSISVIVAMLGILKAGGAYVPLDPAYPWERLCFMLDDSGAGVLVTSGELAAGFLDYAHPVVRLDLEQESLSLEKKSDPERAVSSRNLAYILYTSGSTGKPKGVMIEHRNVVGFLYSYKQVTLDGDKRVGTSVASFSFDTSVEEIYASLCFGGTLHIISAADSINADFFADYLVDHKITTSYIVPDMLARIARRLQGRRDELALQCLITGLAPKKQSVLQSFRQLSDSLRILNAYGPTEVTYGATAYEFLFAADPERNVPIGKPFPNYEVYITDAFLQPTPVGVPGELLIGGVGLARGYRNRPDLTAEKFISNPFSADPHARLYKTGDVCCFREDGNVEFVGRADNQVKIRGFRVEPGEIETALLEHVLVDRVVVMARKIAPGDTRLVAYIVSEGAVEFPVADLRKFLVEKLPSFMLPSAYVILDDLPLMPNGKVDQGKLPMPSSTRPVFEESLTPPATAMEVQLVEIWQKVIKVAPIGIRDNFFDLGGDSLLAAVLLVETEKNLGVRLPMAALFQAPTIEKLQGYIAGVPFDTNMLLVSIHVQGALPPLFLIHVFGSVQNAYQLAKRLGVEQPIYFLRYDFFAGAKSDNDWCSEVAVKSLAVQYLQEVRKICPDGPYFLCGYSQGGVVALEMASDLRAAGKKVPMLYLIDPINMSFQFKEVPLQYVTCQLMVKKIALVFKFIGSSIKRRVSGFLNKNSIVHRGKKYCLENYDGDVTFFESTKHERGYNSSIGWEGVFSGKVQIIQIPYEHVQMMKKPDVDVVIEKLAGCIRS